MLVIYFLIAFISMFCSRHNRSASLWVVLIYAICGCVGFGGKVGKEPGFEWGLKSMPVINSYLRGVKINPRYPWFPLPSSLGYEEEFLIVFCSTSLIAW